LFLFVILIISNALSPFQSQTNTAFHVRWLVLKQYSNVTAFQFRWSLISSLLFEDDFSFLTIPFFLLVFFVLFSQPQGFWKILEHGGAVKRNLLPCFCCAVTTATLSSSTQDISRCTICKDYINRGWLLESDFERGGKQRCHHRPVLTAEVCQRLSQELEESEKDSTSVAPLASLTDALIGEYQIILLFFVFIYLTLNVLSSLVSQTPSPLLGC
jgi:hypothetical protein